MTRCIGGIWIVYQELDAATVRERLADVGTVNIHVPARYLSAGSSCLALLSATPDAIDYIAVATAGRQAGDLERKVVFGPAVKFRQPLEVEVLIHGLQPKFACHVEVPRQRVVGLPEKTWEALIDYICKSDAVEEQSVQKLRDLLSSRKTDRDGSLSLAVQHERDAVAVSFDTFGGSALRQRYLTASPATSDAPFIKALERSGVAVLEDRMIDHDLMAFPGSSALQRHLVGAVRVETDNGSLTIVNANRTGIERTLGVDLVYYHHSYKSFVMIQYKRLTGEGEPVYRPSGDRSYGAELDRMNRFLRATEQLPKDTNCTGFRLQDNPFYFKLCAAKQPAMWSGQLLPGMYFPLDLWQKFMSSDAAKGPLGGVAIGWGNATRRLTNTEFTRLLRGGWIGSSGEQTNQLNDIIEAELSADKSVIAAIQSERRTSTDHLRDTKGRFAADGDPDAL